MLWTNLDAEVNRLTQEHGQEAFSMPVFAQQLIDEKNAEIDHLNEHILQLQAVGDVPSHSDTGAAGNVIADTPCMTQKCVHRPVLLSSVRSVSQPDTRSQALRHAVESAESKDRNILDFINKNDERIETLQTHLTGAQLELRATQEELRATQEQLGAAERERETAQEELSLLQRKQTEKELNIKQQVEALEHEMTQLRTEHDRYRVDMEQSLATVNAALGQKDTQLTQTLRRLEVTQTELSDTKRHQANIAEQHNIAQSQVTQMTDQLTESAQQLTELTQQLTESKQHQNDNVEELAEIKQQLTDSQRQLTKAEEHLIEHKYQLTKAQQQVTEDQQQQIKTELALSRTKEKLCEISEQLTERSQQLTERSQQLTERSQQLTEISRQLTEANNELVEATQLLADVRFNSTRMTRELTEAHQQLAETLLQLTDATQQLTETKNQLTETNNQLTETMNQLTETKNHLTETKQELNEVKQRLGKTDTEYETYQRTAEVELANIWRHFEQREHDFCQVEEELKAVSDTLEKERSRSQAELEQLQDQLRQANQSRQATDSSHQVAACRLEDTLRQKEAETSALTHELAEVRERLERAEEGRGQLEHDLEELKETLSEKQRETETLAQQLHNIQRQTDGIMANTQARYETEIQQLEEQLKNRDTRMDKTVSSHLESQRDLGAALVDAKRTIQGQEQQIRSLTSTECDLQHKVSDLRCEVGLLQEQLRSEIAPEKGGGDAESSPSSSTLPRAGKTALTQAELQVQKLEQLLSEMSTEYEQRLVEVKQQLGCEKQESIDQIRRQLQKHHTDEINRLIVDHQRELQRLQPAGETSDDDSLIELARKVHVEIDRNEQIDSRMMGYLRRPDAQGVSDVADAAPSSVVAANGQVVHSPDGSTEQATTLQGILRKIHSEGIKKLSPPELHLLRRYGDAASQGDEHHGGWEEERSSLMATIDSLREATGKTQPCLPPSQERLSGNDLTQEVSDLQQQLAALKVTLQGEKERQMEERTRMEEQHRVLENQLRRQVELLEFKVQQEKAVSADLRSSLAAEKVQLSELSGQLSDDRTSGSRLQTELGDTQARVSMLQDALAREQARLASTSCALEEQRRQTGRLNEALVIEKANSAQCLDRLDTEKEHSTEYRERTSHVIQKLKQDMESEKQSHLEAASALERERVAVASLRREVELERDQHRSTQTKYKAKVEQLRTSLELHKARCEELNSALQRERQLGAQLRDILDDERSSQQDISERERAAITDLQALLDLERSKLIELQEALQHERDTVAALNDDLLSVKADFSESLTRERAACRQLKTALETLQAQKEDLKTRVQMSEERLHEVQMDRDRWQTSVLATRPHVHQAEPPFEVTEERDIDRLRQSVSETTRLTQNSAETERLRETVTHLQSQLAETERLRETVTHLQSQLAETRRAEVEARETCNLLRLKSAMAPSDGGNAHHQLNNGDKIQDTRLASEGAPPVSHKAVIARKQMESLRQQLQLLCIRLQEEFAHSATRSSASLQRGGVDPVLEVESIKTALKDILFELQELQTALTSTSQGDSVGHAVPGLNERILSHNSELTAFISRLSAEKQHLRRTLSILEQDLLQQQQSDRQLEQQASMGNSRERSHLSLQLSRLERELAATQTELHRLQVERESVLHSPTHTDSTTDRLKLQRLYGRYLKSESFRKALIYQKKYLLVLIGGFQDSEEQTLATIAQMGVYPSGGALQRQLRYAQPFTKFRSAVRAVIAISRLKFLVRKWRRATRGANIGSAPTDRGVAGGIAMTRHSANSENPVARLSEKLYQAPPGSSERLYQAPPGSSERLYQAPPGSRYTQSASVHSSLHTTPPTRERSAESRRVPPYSSPGLAAYSSPGLAPYSSLGLTFNSPTARREMLTALDPMLESTPPPPPSLSDGGAQSPLLSHTDGCDHDNYIERLEHLQLRLGAASRGSLSNNRR
ncbi:hypothetical protein LSAT2_027481 [Lamellibrachia satsuma]|nr:hypothetical protein LSAT2_027481 [Lamellibrachia satsuma]